MRSRTAIVVWPTPPLQCLSVRTDCTHSITTAASQAKALSSFTRVHSQAEAQTRAEHWSHPGRGGSLAHFSQAAGLRSATRARPMEEATGWHKETDNSHGARWGWIREPTKRKTCTNAMRDKAPKARERSAQCTDGLATRTRWAPLPQPEGPISRKADICTGEDWAMPDRPQQDRRNQPNGENAKGHHCRRASRGKSHTRRPSSPCE